MYLFFRDRFFRTLCDKTKKGGSLCEPAIKKKYAEVPRVVVSLPITIFFSVLTRSPLFRMVSPFGTNVPSTLLISAPNSRVAHVHLAHGDDGVV